MIPDLIQTLMGIGIAAIAGVVIFIFGGRSRDRKRTIKELEANAETTERMEEAELGNDPAAADEFLRNRNKRKRRLSKD